MESEEWLEGGVYTNSRFCGTVKRVEAGNCNMVN